MPADDDCPFCAIIEGSAPVSIVYEDDEVVAFLTISPATTGHTLVVPRQHADGLTGLSETDGEHTFGVAMRVAAALRGSENLRADGINLFLADGEAAGQEVFHVHLHVVPRHEGDSVAVSLRGDEPTREELDDVAASLSAHL